MGNGRSTKLDRVCRYQSFGRVMAVHRLTWKPVGCYEVAFGGGRLICVSVVAVRVLVVTEGGYVLCGHE